MFEKSTSIRKYSWELIKARIQQPIHPNQNYVARYYGG
jgi:hypothetical protein